MKLIEKFTLIYCIILLSVSGIYYWQLTDKTQISLSFVVWLGVSTALLLMINLIYFIIIAIKNNKEFKKFRKNLKPGDKTDQGIVIEVTNDNVRLEKNISLKDVYPPFDKI